MSYELLMVPPKRPLTGKHLAQISFFGEQIVVADVVAQPNFEPMVEAVGRRLKLNGLLAYDLDRVRETDDLPAVQQWDDAYRYVLLRAVDRANSSEAQKDRPAALDDWFRALHLANAIRENQNSRLKRWGLARRIQVPTSLYQTADKHGPRIAQEINQDLREGE